MTETSYHKIDSLFKRDPATKFKRFLMWDFSRPEFKYLEDTLWVWHEKIDGTNIRVIWDGSQVTFGGRTDNAVIPAPLVKFLVDTFTVDRLRKVFNDTPAVIYGEGCGPKIQKGGGNYGDHQRFIGFDVKVGSWWLLQSDVNGICEELGVQHAPQVGLFDFDEAVAICQSGRLLSKVNNNKFHAEGLIGRPMFELSDRAGRRLITKLKLKDFVDV